MGNQYTGSISRGRAAANHNLRLDHKGKPLEDSPRHPKHIDYSRSADNVVIVNKPLDEVYRETFGAALEQYNAKQVAKGHPERQIDDYLAKVEADKKLHTSYEFVIQVGNKDEHPPATEAVEIYKAFDKEFQLAHKGHFAVTQAVVHLDEQVAHMHYTVVPVAESKRGLATQNSMNKAMAQAGYSNYKEMLAAWDKMLTEQMQERGLERVAGDRERQLGGVDIETYKRSMDVRQEIERERTAANAELAETKQRAQQATEQAQQAKDELAKAQQDTLESRVELGRCQEQIAEKQALAGDLERQNAEKTAEIEGLKVEIGRFSAEKEAVEDRLECLRPREVDLRAEVDQLKEQVAEREHAPAPANPGDDRQAAGQEQQEQGQERAGEQGRSIGEQGAGLVRELAEAAQRASQGDGRSLGELEQERSAAESRVGELEQRVADLEKQRDATADRVEGLKGAYERAEQKHELAQQSHEAAERKNGEAERRNQLASNRLHDLKGRVAELRERVVERVTELREQLGRAQAIEVFKDVRDRVADGREALHNLLTDKFADRVNDALAQHQQPQQEQQQEYSARDWARYEQDMGRER